MTAPQAAPGPRSGGRILVDQLLIHGVDTAFCVPGESYLAATDAMYDVQDRLRLIVCRQEGGATNMAEAYGKLTGRPGVCFVTRGPGATNASIGIHTARHDSTPLVLFVGQVPRDHRGRGAFQEVDFEAMYGDLAKWVTEVDDARRLPEIVGRAFTTAVSGRPGPVVVSLPEDMLTDDVTTVDAPTYAPVITRPGTVELAELADLLGRAERPLMIVGGSGWTPDATKRLAAFAERHELPVAASFRRQDIMDNTSESYVGALGSGADPKLTERLRTADLLLVVGTRLIESDTRGYTLVTPPRPAQTLVHVHPDPAELGRVYQPDLAINAGVAEFAEALSGLDVAGPRAWADSTRVARADHFAHRVPSGGTDSPAVDLSEVVAHVSDVTPDDAIIASGAGNYTAPCHRYYTFSRYPTQLAPTSGAMGYGVPAAVAAKLLHPEREVVAFAGDGCFLMTGQELATAVQYDALLVIIVANNSSYGTIRSHQESRYPGRPIATALRNPDFAAYAQAFGAYGERVERTADFPAAFARARAAGRPALIELITE